MTDERRQEQRRAIVDAFLALIAEREVDRISLADIADRAGVSLAELAAAFPGKLAIIDAWARRIDAEVLALDASDMAAESARERMFDVLMSRIDALRPHRDAVRGLARSAARDPALALALNALAVRSHTWMLAASGVQSVGWRGRFVAQGMAVLFARVLRVFVREEDPGLPRTMAALDRELREAERRYLRLVRFTGPWVRERAAPSSAAPWPTDPQAPSAAAVDAKPGAPQTEEPAPLSDTPRDPSLH